MKEEEASRSDKEMRKKRRKKEGKGGGPPSFALSLRPRRGGRKRSANDGMMVMRMNKNQEGKRQDHRFLERNS